MGADVFGVADMARYDKEVIGFDKGFAAPIPFCHLLWRGPHQRRAPSPSRMEPTIFYLQSLSSGQLSP